MKKRQKTKKFWILAQSGENCGSQGKNRVFGYNTKYPRMRSDQKTYFLKNKDIGKKQVNFQF